MLPVLTQVCVLQDLRAPLKTDVNRDKKPPNTTARGSEVSIKQLTAPVTSPIHAPLKRSPRKVTPALKEVSGPGPVDQNSKTKDRNVVSTRITQVENMVNQGEKESSKNEKTIKSEKAMKNEARHEKVTSQVEKILNQSKETANQNEKMKSKNEINDSDQLVTSPDEKSTKDERKKSLKTIESSPIVLFLKEERRLSRAHVDEVIKHEDIPVVDPPAKVKSSGKFSNRAEFDQRSSTHRAEFYQRPSLHRGDLNQSPFTHQVEFDAPPPKPAVVEKVQPTVVEKVQPIEKVEPSVVQEARSTGVEPTESVSVN